MAKCYFYKSINSTQLIRLKPGQTFDDFAENEDKWVRYKRSRFRNVNGLLGDAVFILSHKATIKNVILGPNSYKHVYWVLLNYSKSK